MFSCVLTVPPACSLDGHFVFSVKATDTDLPIDPSSLVVKDQPQCIPVITTPDAAVFKIGVTDCGAKMKVIQILPYLTNLILARNSITCRTTQKVC